MPNMSGQSAEISDPALLLSRIMYRNERMKTELGEKNDPVKFIKLMAGHNKTELRRLANVLNLDVEV